MAFPVDAARVGTDSPTSQTTHSVSLPSVVAGDTLVAVVACPGNGTSISWPAGWTEKDEFFLSNSGDRGSLATRVCDGSEGSTITVTLGSAGRLAAVVWKLTGVDQTNVLEFTRYSGGQNQPNGGSHTASGGAKDYTWMNVGFCEDSRGIVSVPSGYSNGIAQANTGSTGTGVSTVFGASKQANAASEDPGAWSLSNVTWWNLWTIAVLPQSVFADTATVPVVLTPSGVDVGPYTDSDTVNLTLTASGIEIGPYLDSETVPLVLTAGGTEYQPRDYPDAAEAYIDIQPSGVEVKESQDAATIAVKLTVLGGECHSTFSGDNFGEGEANLRWNGNALLRWSGEDNLRWTGSVSVGDQIHC